jgi:hypothetical protein
MRNDKIIPGLVLVLIGAAFLLNNFGILHFHWYNIIHLWPIFLVIGGINLVFAHNRSPWATILKISVVIIGFGLVLFGDFGSRYGFWPSHFTYIGYKSGDNWDDSDSGNVKTNGKGDFNEPYSRDAKVARLNISGGGTSYYLSDTTNQLFTAATNSSNNRYNFTQSKDDSVYVLDFKMRNGRHGFSFGSDNNRADFRLNTNPEWEIKTETGASSLNFDLSKFKVRELKLHGGAAEFNVKLGAPLAMTDVDVSTGLANVTINVPQNAACSIETNSGLSNSSIEGISKTSDNHWETTGYEAAKTKIHIHIHGGLSDFKVRRY